MELNISVAIYIGILVLVVFAVWAEWKDLKSKAATSYAEPNRGDSFSEIIQKIKMTSKYESNSIFWRRAIIAAIVSSFLILYITNKKIPDGITMATAFLITYIIIYIMITVFQKLISSRAVNQIEELTRILEKSRT